MNIKIDYYKNFFTSSRRSLVASTDYSVFPSHSDSFNASTTIRISLPLAADLSVVVYIVVGQQVATLANGQFSAGSYMLTYDATAMASGLYFVRAVVIGELTDVQKVMLVR